MIDQTISHYRIVEELGKGGMGLVYKAQDTKLKRAVAIKLLAAHMVASDTDRQRFYREARAAAALHHPNIATVFEIDETEEGHPFIVMEYIEGQPLDVGLAERPLPLEQAVAVALQIAEALKAAHGKDIVHRDIKSANVMLTTAGRAKVLDFGLAKTMASTKLTQLGSTLGTVAYMSPEQARGEEVDHRTDLWSLGVVLYEMVSGQLPFPGDYEQSVMYGIMNAEPEPLTGLRTGVPMALEQVVTKCLRKDRALRYQHADDLIADLQAIDRASLSGSRVLVSTDRLAGTASSDVSHEARVQARLPFRFSLGTLIPWVIAAALGIAVIVLLARESPEPPLPLTSSLNFKAGEGPEMGTGRNLALSLDGAQLAYVTSVSFDGGRVWIHDLADGNRRALTGTEGAERPFWSPDGSMLGYFAEQALHVVPAKGGPSIRLASAPQPSGGTWNAQGVILYNPAGGALFRIPASGGTPIQVTQLTRKGERHESPVFLPNGQHFLFWIIDHSKDDTQYIYKGDLETGQIEQIREGADPAYAASGLLVFRIGADFDIASIFAQRFDPESGTLSGQLLPLLSDLRTPTNNAVLSVTRRTIVFAPKLPGGQDIPILTSRNGGVLDSLAHRERAFTLRFSHDGRRVAFAFKELWVYDLARNISERIPTEVTFPYHFAWSPDDSSIVYSTTRARGQLRVVQVDGTAKEKTIFQSDAGNIEPPEWSPDGRTILFVYVPDETRMHRELWACDVEKGTASRVLDGSFNVFEARFAPNGAWYAYTSDEGGDNSDVYLRPFPGSGAPIRVSAGGGAWPRWREDGKELFYVNGEGYLVAVQVKFEGRPSVSQAKIVMADPIAVNQYNSAYPSFDVHADGQRFLLQQYADASGFSQLTILRDWVGMLEGRE